MRLNAYLARAGVASRRAADDLIKRGVSEGFLLNRSEAAVDAVLAHGFGAFVEDRHLAGIGALLPGGDGVSGEIASLYALTRFLGEGVGVSLVQWGVAEARRLGLAYVFACTTSDRVGQSVGAYELEGLGVQLFERIEGDYFTILGLPLLPVLGELRARGIIAK